MQKSRDKSVLRHLSKYRRRIKVAVYSEPCVEPRGFAERVSLPAIPALSLRFSPRLLLTFTEAPLSPFSRFLPSADLAPSDELTGELALFIASKRSLLRDAIFFYPYFTHTQLSASLYFPSYIFFFVEDQGESSAITS